MPRIVFFTDYINGLSSDDSKQTGYLDEYPDQCPVCHFSIEAKDRMANKQKPRVLEVVFNCTRKQCGSLFIGYYDHAGSDRGVTHWRLDCCLPFHPTVKAFQEEISQLSPLFTEIFNQAENAEAFELDQVAGMGYRKALEFLIKDYLIDFKNEDRDNIEKKYLGNCIKDHIENHNIRVVAERATWLGNDETHYVRKWEDKDVTDLKKLIDLVVYWISSEILTHNIIKEMP